MQQSKLSRSTQHRIDRTSKRVEKISILASSSFLSEEALTTLFGRASINSFPDGFSSSSGAARVSGSGSEHTPTEATVLAREKRHYDPLAEAVKKLEHLLAEAEKLMGAAIDSVRYVQSTVDDSRGRQWVSSPCPIDPADAIEKSGYCLRHYNDWVNHGRPNKHAWLLFKTEAVDNDGELIVKECPPPGDGQNARRGPYAKKSE